MSVVVAEKNHEQYLEQIEKAVANTTMDILEKHSGDLRAMAKVCAEKQVEINRLKEFQDNDRKTIRSLRLKLKEAVDEIEANEHDVKTLENTREAVRKALGVEPDPTAETLVKKIEELKEEIECRCSTWDTKEKEYEAEIAELKPRAYEFRRMADNYDYLSLCNDLRKEEIEKLNGEADVRFAIWQEAAGQIEILKAENEKLKVELEEATAREDSMFQTLNKKRKEESEWALKKIEELKKENKGLRNGGGDYISRKEHQKVCDILNDEAEDYKVKFMTITGQLK